MACTSTCNPGKHFLTLVFASIFVVSLGAISHDAFAMGQTSCQNQYYGTITNATIIAGNQTYHPLKDNVSFQMLNDQSYYLTYTFKTANQSNQGNSLPGQVLFATNEVGYTESGCGDGYNSNQNYTISGYGSYPQDFNPQVNQTQVVSYWVGSIFSYTVNWISPTTQSSTAPSAPQNLSAVTTPSSQIDLSWTAPSNNGDSAVTGYEVERSRGSLSFGGFSNSTNTTFFSTSNATAFADTGLSTSTTYNYTVFAKNSVGPSPHSNTASATTSTVTSSPTGLAATTVSSSQIHLSWTAPANNGGATITGYTIERSTDSGSTWSSLVANTGSTSTKYSDTGLTQNTSYVYRVSAINSAGVSAPSNTSSATTPSNITAPLPPTGLTTTVVSSSQIDLSWVAPSSNGGSTITGYDIDRSTNNGNTWSTVTSNTGSTTTTYNDTRLSPSTAYTYRVSAINSAGTSSPSNISSATTGTITTNGITLDNVQSTSGSTSPSNPIMLADFNVGTGNNRLLVVGVSADNGNVGSITFGGISLTKKVSSFHNNDAEFWYLVNPTGTGAIVVTMKGSTSAIVGAYSFSGVNQSSPLPTSIANYNSAEGSPTVSIIAKFANDFILDLPSIYGGVTLGASTCTQQWNTHMPGAITGASSSKVVPTPGAVTCKWTASSGDLWDDVALEIGAASK